MRPRTIAAFLSAPLAAALFVLLSKLLATHNAHIDVADFAFSIVVWWVYTAILTVLIALPTFLVLRRFNLVRWWTAIAAGSVVGVAGSFVVNAQTPTEVSQVVIAGAAGGLVFWFVASGDLRPNKSLEPTREG